MPTTLAIPPHVREMPDLLKKPRLLPWERKLRGTLFNVPPPIVTWMPSPALPQPRWGGTAFNLANKLWIVGGYYQNGFCADIDVFDPATATWSTIPYPFTYWEQTFALSGGKIYAISGCQACWTLTPAVEVFDPATGLVTACADVPIACIMAGAATGPDGRIFVMGGCTPPTDPSGPPDSYLDVVQIFDPAFNAWSQGPTMAVTRDQFPAVAANGKIYVFGGFNTYNLYPRTDVYDPASNSWQQLADMPTPRRCCAAALADSGHIYVIGGLSGPTLATVEAFDPSTNTWAANTPLATARWSLGAATVLGHIYAAGGFIRIGPGQPDNANVYALDTVERTI